MFIRFGEIPKDEQSTIHYRGYNAGKEIGVSVFDCMELRGQYHIVLPVPFGENAICDIENFLFYDTHRQIYLVEGDIVGFGVDNEPLIKNVKIIKNITEKFRKDIYEDEDVKHIEMLKKVDLFNNSNFVEEYENEQAN